MMDDEAGHPSMLLAFRAENIYSFYDELDFSMEATAQAEEGVPRDVHWHQKGGRPLRVLPAAGVFGANASGKTNLLKALYGLREHVLFSFRSGDPSGGIHRHSFRLDPGAGEKPTRYEIDLVLNGVRHEYGVVMNDQHVLHEWAYRYPNGRAALIFERTCGKQVDIPAGKRTIGRAIERIARPNALFLSAAAAGKHPDLLPLYDWFGQNLKFAEASSRQARWAFTAQLLREDASREQVLALLRAADLGISDVRIRPPDPKVLERVRRAILILTGHEDDAEGFPDIDLTELGLVLSHRGAEEDVDFNVSEESLGTLVWLGIVGPVFDALEAGSVLLADELESSLHPTLAERIIGLFQDPEANPNGAQLIFSSHAPTLLGNATQSRPLGRDQVWFTEKLVNGRSRLYPLSDLSPRQEEAIGKRYLSGRYGATPIVSHEEFVEVARLIAAGGRK
ncbi:ATP-binding protein [Nonomuraea sp. NPDC050404]|uniref:AAA family ATPase n=1 Tax=Nonomuraea sp. NPDC050404 TaxID=3155783 RepID=UPI0033FEB30F